MGHINNTFSGGNQRSNDSEIISPIHVLPSTEDCCIPNNIDTTNDKDVLQSRRIDTALPLQGGGDLSENRTLFILPSTDFQDGYLTKEDHILLGLNKSYKVLFGYAVWSGTGLTYNVSTCIYRINGVIYTTAPTTVTLAANPVNNRIDVIYLTTSQTVGVLTGTPQTNPVKPLVNFATQIELTFITLATGATTPTGLSQILVYDENLEWNTNVSAGVNYDNLVSPFTGTKSVLHNAGISSSIFTATSIVTIQSAQFLKFYVRLTVPNSAKIFVQLEVTSVAAEANYTVAVTALHGLDISIINTYQLVIVPLSDFFDVDLIGIISGVNIIVNGSDSLYIDKITLISSSTSNANPGSKIYHVPSASFFDGTNYHNSDMVGKNLAIFYQGINRYLESNEWEPTSLGFRILLPDFNAITELYSLFVTTNLIEA